VALIIGSSLFDQVVNWLIESEYKCTVTEMPLFVMHWSVCLLQRGIISSGGCFCCVFNLPDQDYCNLMY
jgi:hypothetical protein